jgi:non-haem Fe2+, alpha-ketoglutarate-dependent halogenase
MQNVQNNEKPQNFPLTPGELENIDQHRHTRPFALYEPGKMKILKVLLQHKHHQLLDRSSAVHQDEGAISGVTNISN